MAAEIIWNWKLLTVNLYSHIVDYTRKFQSVTRFTKLSRIQWTQILEGKKKRSKAFILKKLDLRNPNRTALDRLFLKFQRSKYKIYRKEVQISKIKLYFHGHLSILYEDIPRTNSCMTGNNKYLKTAWRKLDTGFVNQVMNIDTNEGNKLLRRLKLPLRTTVSGRWFYKW